MQHGLAPDILILLYKLEIEILLLNGQETG